VSKASCELRGWWPRGGFVSVLVLLLATGCATTADRAARLVVGETRAAEIEAAAMDTDLWTDWDSIEPLLPDRVGLGGVYLPGARALALRGETEWALIEGRRAAAGVGIDARTWTGTARLHAYTRPMRAYGLGAGVWGGVRLLGPVTGRVALGAAALYAEGDGEARSQVAPAGHLRAGLGVRLTSRADLLAHAGVAYHAAARVYGLPWPARMPAGWAPEYGLAIRLRLAD
jgi:opacity protein-like surface antigen